MACYVPYPVEGLFRNRINQEGITLLTIERGMDLRILVQGPKDQLAQVVTTLTNESQGRIEWVEV